MNDSEKLATLTHLASLQASADAIERRLVAAKASVATLQASWAAAKKLHDDQWEQFQGRVDSGE